MPFHLEFTAPGFRRGLRGARPPCFTLGEHPFLPAPRVAAACRLWSTGRAGLVRASCALPASWALLRPTRVVTLALTLAAGRFAGGEGGLGRALFCKIAAINSKLIFNFNLQLEAA